MPRTASSPIDVAKAECKAAHRAAVEASPGMRGLLDRWMAETLTAVDGFPVEARGEVWRRQRILYRIIEDRAGWARGVMR